jgi:hypothetical protein
MVAKERTTAVPLAVVILGGVGVVMTPDGNGKITEVYSFWFTGIQLGLFNFSYQT